MMKVSRLLLLIVWLGAHLLLVRGALAVDLHARLEQLNQREKQLIEKQEGLRQRERDIEEKLDEVRVLKQSILNKLEAQKPGVQQAPPTAAPVATP